MYIWTCFVLVLQISTDKSIPIQCLGKLANWKCAIQKFWRYCTFVVPFPRLSLFFLLMILVQNVMLIKDNIET